MTDAVVPSSVNDIDAPAAVTFCKTLPAAIWLPVPFGPEYVTNENASFPTFAEIVKVQTSGFDPEHPGALRERFWTVFMVPVCAAIDCAAPAPDGTFTVIETFAADAGGPPARNASGEFAGSRTARCEHAPVNRTKNKPAKRLHISRSFRCLERPDARLLSARTILPSSVSCAGRFAWNDKAAAARKARAMESVQATLFADGGSRGNPGPAASGAVLLGPDGTVLREIGEYLGRATNNVAEWTALALGLQAALDEGVRTLAVRLDSELVVKQLSGEYRVKHPDLQPIHQRVRGLLRRFEHVDVRHVRRKENALADALVNRILDAAG